MFEPFTPKELKNKKVSTKFREEIEPQEILLDALSGQEDLVSQRKFEVPLQKRTLQGFCILFFLSIFLLLAKTFELQMLKNETFAILAEQNYQRSYFQRSLRGVIYDQDFNQLVFNDLSFDLVANKNDFPTKEDKKEEVLEQIAMILKEDLRDLKKKIEESKELQVLIAEKLDRHALISIQPKLSELPGFYIQENIKRFYLDGSVFSHIIGYLGRIDEKERDMFENYSPLDYIGKAGLEKSYERVLRGKKGEILIKKDAWGREIFREKIGDPEPGKSLVLWLDSNLQNKLTQALKDSLKKTGAKTAAAVALDPQTGGVLALVSLPSFDNNLFFQKVSQEKWAEIFSDPLNPFFNRALAGTYPTGSTIKPLVAIAALEENIIWPEKNIFDEGQIVVENPWFPDNPWVFHDWKAHGWVDMRKAIAESCNVYFYTVGGGYGEIKGLGAEKIKKYLQLFGWGEVLGIDLPGEKPGLIPDKKWKEDYFEDEVAKIWLPGDTYNLSIGQGYLSITPLQVASSFAALANGGKFLRPEMVKQIIEGSKDSYTVLQEFQPIVIRENFVDQTNLKVAREGMREAVIYGSSRILLDLPVKAASKTGTAQTSREGYYHNWVTVFAPYEDPEIVLTIVIENVPEEQIAVLPVAKEVLNWYFSR